MNARHTLNFEQYIYKVEILIFKNFSFVVKGSTTKIKCEMCQWLWLIKQKRDVLEDIVTYNSRPIMST